MPQSEWYEGRIERFCPAGFWDEYTHMVSYWKVFTYVIIVSVDRLIQIEEWMPK